MTRRLLIAALAMLAFGALAGWRDSLHLLAGGLAALLLALGAVAVAILRRRTVPEDVDGDLDEAESALGASLLRDGVGGMLLGGVGLLLTAVIYGYALPPLYPLLVGDCPEILPRLGIYEETGAWERALAVVDTRLARPLDQGCRAELARRKCRYLIEWSRALPREQAELKLREAEAWAEKNGLGDYRTIAQLMRSQLQPTTTPPRPVLVTPTPTPAPTPRSLAAGTSVQLTGVDAAYFPPTLFAYLRVVDGAGQPVVDLAASDVRVEDDGQPVATYSLTHFSRAAAPISAALVIDYSGSMAGEPLAAAKGGARAFLGLLGGRDQAEIIGFNDRAQVLQAWTADRQAAAQALDLLSAKDWTALWDALWLATSDLSGASGRKAIVVLTDGVDNRSQHTLEEVTAQARRVGLSVFAIGLRSSEYNGAALQALVQAVGGRYTEASSPAELEDYYRQTAGAIRNEYRLALTLNRQPTGGAHRLRVLVGGPQALVAEQAYQDPGGSDGG